MINKRYKTHFLIVFAISAIMLLIASFYDYKISEFLYAPDSFLAVFLSSFGAYFIFLFIPFTSITLIRRSKAKIGFLIIGFAILFVSFVVPIYFANESLLRSGFSTRNDPYTLGLLAGVLTSLVFLYVRSLDKQSLKKVISVCVFAFLLLLFTGIVLFSLKFSFSRDKYSDIITLSQEFKFTPWYSPEFFANKFSFVCEYTAGCMGLLTLLVFPFVFDFFEGREDILFVIVYMFAFFMGLSRIMLGKSFLSDVSIAIMMMSLIFIMLTPIFEKLYLLKKRLETKQKPLPKPKYKKENIKIKKKK